MLRPATSALNWTGPPSPIDSPHLEETLNEALRSADSRSGLEPGCADAASAGEGGLSVATKLDVGSKNSNSQDACRSDRHGCSPSGRYGDAAARRYGVRHDGRADRAWHARHTNDDRHAHGHPQ